MGIMLSKVRISNFRSIESMELDLGLSNLLIGQNNTGKTNFLKALNVAISGAMDITENDIFIANGEHLEKTKTAIIDVLFQPTDSENNVCREFSDFWTSVFTETWITTSGDGNFVGIRTEIKFDQLKDSYVLRRHCIRQWGTNATAATIETKKTSFNEDMRNYLQSFYMDANRDIVQDLRNRKSYFGRVTSSYDMSPEKVAKIEQQLSSVNAMIIESIPSLQQTQERISVVGQTIGTADSSLEIEPLARKIADLSKGMNIVMQDGGGASFPISQHGYGTRSWISFLTLSAFVENQNQKLRDDEEAEQFIMLTMEEPEAHLHPQAQRQLFDQISSFEGQKVVSTHSPSIIAQSTLADVIYFNKRDGKTSAIRYKADCTTDDGGMIFREVINTRADLLFASAVILCEGITEELALPVYFREYFGCASFSLGVSIINVGGKKKYKPYLSLIKDFNIPWFIFSDGEADTIKDVKSAVKTVFDLDATTLPNIVILDYGDDYEKYLIHAGYMDLITDAISEYEDDQKFLDSYIEQMHGQKCKGGGVRNYDGEDGRTKALTDFCHKHKTDYAVMIAERLILQEEKDKRIPPKIKDLFSALESTIVSTKVTVTEGVK